MNKEEKKAILGIVASFTFFTNIFYVLMLEISIVPILLDLLLIILLMLI